MDREERGEEGSGRGNHVSKDTKRGRPEDVGEQLAASLLRLENGGWMRLGGKEAGGW